MPGKITVSDLQARMDRPEGIVLLDVRSAGAFLNWHINGRRVTSLNIQNSRLKNEGVESFPEIPKDREIITVCAKGVAAQDTAQILNDAGYSALYLEGGMAAWAQFYTMTLVAREPYAEVYQIRRPAKGCVSYMIASDKEAVVIDAGRHIREYVRFADLHGVTIKHVLDTHLHADHITGGKALAELVGAKYWIADEEVAGTELSYIPLVHEGRIQFGSSELHLIPLITPGHTAATTTFLLNNTYWFSADTVFVQGLGRPDLKGQAEEMANLMFDTVHSRLSSLRDDVLVLPGHYSSDAELNEDGFVGVSLGSIRDSNAMFQQSDRMTFVNQLLKSIGETPPNHETVINVNRGRVILTDEESAELENGPNRCAAKV